MPPNPFAAGGGGIPGLSGLGLGSGSFVEMQQRMQREVSIARLITLKGLLFSVQVLCHAVVEGNLGHQRCKRKRASVCFIQCCPSTDAIAVLCDLLTEQERLHIWRLCV